MLAVALLNELFKFEKVLFKVFVGVSDLVFVFDVDACLHESGFTLW